tara:strand:- start:1597 stop:2757 length:1161 start_codon:yes stop_codon:yes gene_type:complete
MLLVLLLLPVWWPLPLPGLPAPEWPGTVAQWRLARADVNLTTLDDAALPAYLSNYHPAHLLRYLPISLAATAFNYGGLYQLYQPDDCAVHFRGVRVVYLHVYRAANRAICQTLRLRVDDGSPPATPSKTIVFTFVREPLSHFISGYSEISARVPTAAALDDPGCWLPQELGGRTCRHPMYAWRRDLYSFLSQAVRSEERAYAFMRDLLAGRLHRVPYLSDVTDVHVWPQVAFLSRAFEAVPHTLSPHAVVHFLGRLETITADWNALGAMVTRVADDALASGAVVRLASPRPPPSWPRWDTAIGRETHPADVLAARKVMATLLNGTAASMTTEGRRRREDAYLCAVVRVLLPDYVCFGYEVPGMCASAIGAHGVPCALQVQVGESSA